MSYLMRDMCRRRRIPYMDPMPSRKMIVFLGRIPRFRLRKPPAELHAVQPMDCEGICWPFSLVPLTVEIIFLERLVLNAILVRLAAVIVFVPMRKREAVRGLGRASSTESSLPEL